MSRVRVNYKSDLPPIEVKFKINGDVVDVPDNDFAIRFFVDGAPGTSFLCSCKDGEYTNCAKTSDTTLECYIDNHKFGCGRLCCEYIDLLTDRRYADKQLKTVTPSTLDIVLVDGVGDDNVEILNATFNFEPNEIVSITTEESPDAGGVNTVTITQGNGEVLEFHVKNGKDGKKGNKGDTGVYVTNPDFSIVDDCETASSTDALSANQGKELNDRLSVVKDTILEDVEYDIDSEDIVDDHNWRLGDGVGSVVSATPTSYEDWSCMRISVSDGDKINISTIGGNTARAWALTDTSRKILSVAEATPGQQTIIDYSITATQEGYLYVNCSSLGYSSFGVVHFKNFITPRISALESEQTELRDDVDTINADLYKAVEIDSSDLEEGESGEYWKLAADGSPVATAPSSVSTYTATGYWACIPEPIPIKEGDVVVISTAGGGNARAWAFTDSEKNLLTNDELHEYVAAANKDTTASPFTVTAEHSGYLYVNFSLQAASTNDFFVKVNENVIDGLVTAVDTLSETVDGLVKNAAGIPHYKNSPLPLWKDTLKVLAIGNSYTEDLTAYLSALIGSSGANIPLSKLCVYTLTQSSSSLQTWVNNYESGTSKSISRVAGSITMGTTSGTVAQILAQDWDVVIMQQLSTYANRYNTFNPYLTKMIGYIRENCTNQQVALAWQSVWSYKEGHTAGGVTYGDSEERWAEICAATKQMMHKDGIDIIIPTGTAIQNARSYQELDPTFNAGNIDDNENIGEVTRDGTHLEFGVGRYIAACTFFQTLIAPMFGVSVLGNPAVHTITSSEQSSSQNVYKGVSVDSTNKGLCQKFAFCATIDMWNITDIDE